MPTTMTSRQSDSELAELVALAAEVDLSAPCVDGQRTARDAAKALAGLASWVAHHAGMAAMQEAMGDLARHVDAWRGPAYFASMPSEGGRANAHVAMIGIVCSSLVSTFGPRNLRAAMAFWASERDAAAWRQVIEA